MSKNININSSEWCDFIFKNRNKAYGAYKMRQSSVKDHLAAFGITTLLLLVMVWIVPTPTPVEKLRGGGGFPIESEIELPILPALPKMHELVTFYEPEITPDNKVIKMTGDDKNGILYEMGEYLPIPVITMTIEESWGYDDGYPYFPHPHCPPPPIDSCEIGCGYPIFDVPPCYPGGENELYKYFKKNLRYPAEASEMGIEGKVLISFTVSKTGKITNPKIVRSLARACDKEAIRLIEKMPTWIPAKHAGRPVNMSFTLPIQFRLI